MYIGQSRSERSQEAIENFEIPLNHFTVDTIENFKESDLNDMNEINQDIFNLSISLWKYVATEKIGSCSWHHSGKYFNITFHYDLYSVAIYLTNNLSKTKKDYNQFKLEQKKEKNQRDKKLEYGWIYFDVWGGSRRHPKIVDYDTDYGYLKETKNNLWLYGYSGKKHKFGANKIEKQKRFNNLNDLKKFLKTDIDLRHFKRFLRKHNEL